uniref:Rho guanine nucleotide exchange factor 37 n=1 Tax=Sus scrofa TaxID=9823 RepID=A0A8D0SUB2_PIG
MTSCPPGQGVQMRKVWSLRTDPCSIRGWPSGSSSTPRPPICMCSSSVPQTSGAACSSFSLAFSPSGDVFLEFQEELEQVYKVYCASYEQALLLVENYQKDPELQRGIQRTIEAVLPQAGPSGLSFLLVNPLQRVTKYPLLLQKILENTLPDASAYPVLQRAASALQDVVTHINEYKRRKEVASRYTKVEQLSLRERLARINTHTLSKKTTRLSQLLKQEAGLVPKLEDKEFDDLEEKFHCVSLCVTELKSNVAAHLDALEVLLRFRPHESHLDIPGGPVAQYGDLARDLQLQAFPQFKQRLEGLVWQPLCSLAKALAGPQNLIRKRLDKLLDFERAEEKLSEVGSVTYEEEAARHTYQALNSLLVAELPQFNQLAVQWLRQILCTLVTLQGDLAKHVLQRAESSLAQLPHHHLSEPAFRDLVADTLDQAGHQLRSFQENFEKVLPPPTTWPLLPGAERQVQALLSRYGPGKLYQVTSNISGSGTLDLTLPRGHVVALLQNKDTKGNSSRWLVDTGGHRGYVPAGKLELYHVAPSEEDLRGQAKPHENSPSFCCPSWSRVISDSEGWAPCPVGGQWRGSQETLAGPGVGVSKSQLWNVCGQMQRPLQGFEG